MRERSIPVVAILKAAFTASFDTGAHEHSAVTGMR
jgi:hypothetical protein